MTSRLRRFEVAITSPQLIVAFFATSMVTLILAIAAFGFAYDSKAKADTVASAQASQAKAQSAATQDEVAFLRQTFCGFFRPISDAVQDPSTPAPTTKFGQQIATGAITTTQLLKCPPLP